MWARRRPAGSFRDAKHFIWAINYLQITHMWTHFFWPNFILCSQNYSKHDGMHKTRDWRIRHTKRKSLFKDFFSLAFLCVQSLVYIFPYVFFNVRVMSLISATQLVSLILLRSSLAREVSCYSSRHLISIMSLWKKKHSSWSYEYSQILIKNCARRFAFE